MLIGGPTEPRRLLIGKKMGDMIYHYGECFGMSERKNGKAFPAPANSVQCSSRDRDLSKIKPLTEREKVSFYSKQT